MDHQEQTAYLQRVCEGAVRRVDATPHPTPHETAAAAARWLDVLETYRDSPAPVVPEAVAVLVDDTAELASGGGSLEYEIQLMGEMWVRKHFGPVGIEDELT